ncbi:hypothetical protein PG991_011682 [Apiospora marii]|uniref:Peptidase S54 rhomboid domain-containing protein n=1 Tax=Apiospora marii TaxID=335849 RepID=A0ABR1REY0_9PEZI
MYRLTGAWTALRSTERPGVIGYGNRMLRIGGLQSPKGYRRSSQTPRAGVSTASKSTDPSKSVAHPPNSFATPIHLPLHPYTTNQPQLDKENSEASLWFDAQMPADTDRPVRRRWTRRFICVYLGVLVGCVVAISDFEKGRQRLQLARGQLIDREEYRRLVMTGQAPDSRQWRFYGHHMVLSSDCAEQGRWHTLFTHVFLDSQVEQIPVSNLVLFSVFFRAAWVAGFGRVGTPLVAACSGVAGGLAFLSSAKKGGAGERSTYGGPTAVVSGLIAAATVARPRMPFFLGFTPAALPLWVVGFVCFIPDLLRWYRLPQRLAEANQRLNEKTKILGKQHEQAVAKRAAELGKHFVVQAPKTEEMPNGRRESPREAGWQEASEAQRRSGSTRPEDAARDEEPFHEKEPCEEETPRKEGEASHKQESQHEDDADYDKELLSRREDHESEKQSTREEGPPPKTPLANETPTKAHGNGFDWQESTPHVRITTEEAQSKGVQYERIGPSFGGAACGAFMGLVLRLMLRR